MSAFGRHFEDKILEGDFEISENQILRSEDLKIRSLRSENLILFFLILKKKIKIGGGSPGARKRELGTTRTQRDPPERTSSAHGIIRSPGRCVPMFVDNYFKVVGEGIRKLDGVFEFDSKDPDSVTVAWANADMLAIDTKRKTGRPATVSCWNLAVLGDHACRPHCLQVGEVPIALRLFGSYEAFGTN